MVWSSVEYVDDDRGDMTDDVYIGWNVLFVIEVKFEVCNVGDEDLASVYAVCEA